MHCVIEIRKTKWKDVFRDFGELSNRKHLFASIRMWISFSLWCCILGYRIHSIYCIIRLFWTLILNICFKVSNFNIEWTLYYKYVFGEIRFICNFTLLLLILIRFYMKINYIYERFPKWKDWFSLWNFSP